MYARRLIVILAVLITVTLFGLTARRVSRPTDASEPPLPFLGTAPQFELENATGGTLTTADMDETIWVADFFFTSCPGPCKVMSSNMESLARTFKGDERVRFVSISIDPDIDTPERLREYAAMYNADPDRWHFVRGPEEEIHRIARDGFSIGSVETASHSTRFMLIDGAGRLRGYYLGLETDDMAKLSEDIAKLLREGA